MFIAVFVLAVMVVGAPAALLVSGAWLIAWGVGLSWPGWQGPAAWAAGVLGSAASVIGGSAVAAAIHPQLQPRWVNILLLALPNVVGVSMAALARRRSRGSAASARPVDFVPAAVVLGVLAVVLLVEASGPFHGVAWAMSGDARNHVAITRSVLHSGGPSIGSFADSPLALNALLAVVSGAGGRSGTSGEVLLHDVSAMAAIYAVAAAAIGTLLSAAVIVVTPSRGRLPGLGGAGPVAVGLAVAAAAGSPFVLGLALADGFFSAYGALPISLAAIVIGMHSLREPRPSPLALVALTVATPLALVAWPVLSVVPFAVQALVTAFTIRHALRGSGSGLPRPRPAAWLAVGASLTVLATVVVVVLLFRAKLSRPGSDGGSGYGIATRAWSLPWVA